MSEYTMNEYTINDIEVGQEASFTKTMTVEMEDAAITLMDTIVKHRAKHEHK